MTNSCGKNELSINKGVELMLRGDKKIPKTKGLFIDKVFSLRKKDIFFKIEIGWRSIE